MAESKRFHEVIQIAAELFYANGFQGTSMNDISKGLGMFKASLYHHVSGKQEILYHVLCEGTKALQRKLDNVLETAENYDFEQLLTKAVKTHIKQNFSNIASSTVFRTELRLLETKYRELVQEQLDKYLFTWLTIFKRGEKQGYLKFSHSPKILVFLLQAMCNNAYQWYRKDGALSLEEVAGMITKTFLHGVVEPNHVKNHPVEDEEDKFQSLLSTGNPGS